MNPPKLLRYLFIGNATYHFARGVYYFPLVKPRNKDEPHLYTDFFGTTIFNLVMTPVSTPVSICKDIIHIEHCLRGIPHLEYDTPFAFSHTYRYKSNKSE